MYLKKKLCCWKSEQTQQQFMVLCHFTVQTENEGKNHLNPLKTDNLSLLELMLLKCLSPPQKQQ